MQLSKAEYDSLHTPKSVHDLRNLQRYIRRAWSILCSDSSERGKQAVIAFGIRGNRIVAVGRNSYSKTHPRQARYARLANQPKKEFLHAEVAALIRAPRDIDTLIVCRFSREGHPALAAPCTVCCLAIDAFNPNLKVIHT